MSGGIWWLIAFGIQQIINAIGWFLDQTRKDKVKVLAFCVGVLGGAFSPLLKMLRYTNEGLAAADAAFDRAYNLLKQIDPAQVPQYLSSASEVVALCRLYFPLDYAFSLAAILAALWAVVCGVRLVKALYSLIPVVGGR